MSNKAWHTMNMEVSKILEKQGILDYCPTCKRPALYYRVTERKVYIVVFEFKCGSGHKWQDDKAREW